MNSNSITKVIKRVLIIKPNASTSYLPFRSNSTASTSTLPSSSSSSSSSPPPPSNSSSRLSSAYPPLPTGSRGTQLYYPSPLTIQSHLSSLLAPISIPGKDGKTGIIELSEDLAVRSMTHKSGDGHYNLTSNHSNQNRDGGEGNERMGDGAVRKGHGEKLTFIGRRTLRLHLNLFLSTGLAHSPLMLQTYLTQESTDTLLDTKELGSGVGKAWGLEKCMRWREVRSPTGEPSGLYKTRGAAVEALMGAIYMQHGIEATNAVFRELVLPNLVFPFSLGKALDEGIEALP